jgi:peroxiredoxin
MDALRQGDLVPDFTVTQADGSRWGYRQIWQRKNLLLVVLPSPADATARSYAEDVCAAREELEALETACVVTSDAVPGVRAPGVIVADRWGEVRLAEFASEAVALPDRQRLIEHLRGIDHECPECQGEVW